MKHIFFLGFFCLVESVMGQSIELPSGTPLTIQGNLNLPTGFSIQYNSQNYLKAPASGSFNTFLGLDAGNSGSGSQNTLIGYQAGYNSTGSSNTFIGHQAGYGNTTGYSNLIGGPLAGYNNTSGSFNVFLGPQAGANNASGSYNMFMGNVAGANNKSGSYNMAIGDGAGYNADASYNTYIGVHAGYDNKTGTNNVFIGYGANVGGSNGGSLSNAVAIGANAVVSASNALVLGNNANVGIGTSTPAAKLELVSGSSGSSGLRLTNLSGSNNRYLVVTAAGDVVAGSASGGRVAADEALWQRSSGGFLQSVQNDAVVIGQGVGRTPAGYKLFVEQGIMTERVKVALKNSSEWSDYVFAPGYRLASLAEVERQIQQTGHLPGIPSAADMVQQGNDLHKTDAKLLEKIEELTLYSIEQQKRIEKLEQMLQQLVQKK